MSKLTDRNKCTGAGKSPGGPGAGTRIKITAGPGWSKGVFLMKRAYLILLAVLLFVDVPAINTLIARIPLQPWVPERAAYLKDVTLVVEPRGAYTEQSLYMWYTDNGMFGTNNVEIVHRFELPQGAIMKDFWLWMGNNVMQALHIDTWRARKMYDSIIHVPTNPDPGYLTKIGDQYELHIFPIRSGEKRKVKITFLVPLQTVNNRTIAELPYGLLRANTLVSLPLHVLFKTTNTSFTHPLIYELPSLTFTPRADTMGFDYLYTQVPNVGALTSLKLSYDFPFNFGTYWSSEKKAPGKNYFELGIGLGEMFNVDTTRTPQKTIYAIDVSGDFSKNLGTFANNIRNMISGSVRPGDSARIVISGGGNIVEITNGWRPYEEIAGWQLLPMFQNYLNSPDGIAANSIIKRKILWMDKDARWTMDFHGISYLTTFKEVANFGLGIYDITKADLVMAYQPVGFGKQRDTVMRYKDSLAVLLQNGGRYLTYTSYQTHYKDSLLKYYVDGIHVDTTISVFNTWFRNENGNLGMGFPPTIERKTTHLLDHQDPAAKTELQNSMGKIAVLSKQLLNGLVVVSGIYGYDDDLSLKSLVNPPIMGLNVTNGPLLLESFLAWLASFQQNAKATKLVLISNSDKYYTPSEIQSRVDNFMSLLGDNRPAIATVNLLDGEPWVIPPVTYDDQKAYYGSGLLLSNISARTGGLHFEKAIYDWDFITSGLNTLMPAVDSLVVTATPQTGGLITEFREIRKNLKNYWAPMFFVGKYENTDVVNIGVTAKFAGSDTVHNRTYPFSVQWDTVNTRTIIPSVVANEKINEMLVNASYDTSLIVSLAFDDRVMCDYTAFLVLEPNDTVHFLINPWDESTLTRILRENQEVDSLMLDIYPNPFNSMSLIRLAVPDESRVQVNIFDITGQLVKTVADEDGVKGMKRYNWNGTDNFNTTLASGVYLVHVKIRSNSSGKTDYISKKIVYLR